MKEIDKYKKLSPDKTYRVFFINITIVIILIITGIFYGLYIRNNELIDEELKARAKTSFSNILLARRWNSGYGGIYVEKKEGVTSNPYLKNPDIETADGKIFTKKNPALMTREISEIAAKYGMSTFRITSLKPLNPENKPDEFEREALTFFEKGVEEIYKKEVTDGKTYYRYMAPLYVEESCLECHAEQGYKFGEVRGGISVKFNIDETEKMLKYNNYIIILLGVVISAVLLVIVRFMVFNLMRKNLEAQRKISEMAVTDDLTGLFNRRYFFSHLNEEAKRAERFGRPLGCAMIDIDNFKAVNDTYGHHAGDLILKTVCDTIKKNCREVDIIVRYGGEEIVILSPELDMEGIRSFGERIRKAVSLLRIEIGGGRETDVTISLGVCSLSPVQLKEMDDFEDIVRLADAAMYSAKNKGKNKVEVCIGF
ncbi:MAG: diguanylate cyclase [Nitrospirae bacterium]|nr:diguanylate cyclase [Nitrospirota bacterium]